MRNNLLKASLGALVASALLACPPPPGACDTSGTGSIVLTFSGLPEGVTPKVTLQGPSAQTVTMAQTLMVGSGNWAVSAELATAADPIVRTAYAGRVSAPNFCLEPGTTQAVDVAFSKVPTSNRLWVGNGSGGTGNLHGFDSTALQAAGMTPSSWSADVAASRSPTFDRVGNLWAIGATTSDPQLGRLPAADFATGTTVRPDRRARISGLSCIPALATLAFDRQGNLAAGSACQKEVYLLSAASLETATGTSDVTLTPALTLSGFQSVDGLAFDAAGNLYVADAAAEQVVRYDASALAGSAPMPSVRLKVRRNTMPADTSAFGPRSLAFDATGNLWSFDFGANVLFFIPQAELSGSGTRSVQPGVRVAVAVGAVLEGLAFDEAGGLWVPYAAGQLARFSPEQLTVSTGAGAPTQPERIVRGSTLGSTLDPAFFPAPKSLPLFHALP
ncbi:MAG: hypothetical protein MUC96_30670 [Myxococcaceae bacterium]|jgi:hypothetical protein|nr:hypothetical protein [Myxococcaceae bacterium]